MSSEQGQSLIQFLSYHREQGYVGWHTTLVNLPVLVRQYNFRVLDAFHCGTPGTRDSYLGKPV